MTALGLYAVAAGGSRVKLVAGMGARARCTGLPVDIRTWIRSGSGDL